MSGFSTSVLPASLGAVLALDQPGGSSSTSSRRRLKPTAPSYGSVHGGQTLGLDGPLAQLAWRAHHPTSPVAWVLIMVVVVSSAQLRFLCQAPHQVVSLQSLGRGGLLGLGRSRHSGRVRPAGPF